MNASDHMSSPAHAPERIPDLYQWNSQLSGAFHEILGHLEIVLRNAIHDRLTVWHEARHETGNWYDDPDRVLESHRLRDIDKTLFRLGRDRKDVTPGGVVAELSFGFWRYLLTKRYEATLWTPALRHAFPNLRPARRNAVPNRNRLQHRLRRRQRDDENFL